MFLLSYLFCAVKYIGSFVKKLSFAYHSPSTYFRYFDVFYYFYKIVKIMNMKFNKNLF